MSAARHSTLVATLAFAVDAVRRLLQTRHQRKVVQTLSLLDDHMLRDIGLSRFDVDCALVTPLLADGTVLIAERAEETRRHTEVVAPGFEPRAGRGTHRRVA